MPTSQGRQTYRLPNGTHIDITGLDMPNLKKKLAELAQYHTGVKVGFLSGATYPNGTKVAYVAYKNEFGGPNPPRPFMKRTLDTNIDKWIKGIKTNIKGLAHNPNVIDRAFKLAGEVAVGDMKITIKHWAPDDPRPNSPATIEAKRARGRNGKNMKAINPNVVLIDTGVMINSIDYEVVNNL